MAAITLRRVCTRMKNIAPRCGRAVLGHNLPFQGIYTRLSFEPEAKRGALVK